jgi:hypothetical protein
MYGDLKRDVENSGCHVGECEDEDFWDETTRRYIPESCHFRNVEKFDAVSCNSPAIN